MEIILTLIMIILLGLMLTLSMALFMTLMRGEDYAIKRRKTEVHKSDSCDCNKTVQLQEKVGASVNNDSTGLP